MIGNTYILMAPVKHVLYIKDLKEMVEHVALKFVTTGRSCNKMVFVMTVFLIRGHKAKEKNVAPIHVLLDNGYFLLVPVNTVQIMKEPQLQTQRIV